MEPLYSWIDYDKFVEVYGNRSKHLHFIAIRFKKAILTYKCSKLDTTPIELQDNTIMVIKGDPCPPILAKDKSVLIYNVGSPAVSYSIRVSDDSTENLLKALFPSSKIVFKHFERSTLYLVATANPFSNIMKSCRKEVAFQALFAVVEAKRMNRALTLQEIADFRFFKKHCDELKTFSRWTPLAHALGYDSFMAVTHARPSEYTGREIYKILKRSRDLPERVNDLDFYVCEIFFSESEPVGLMCLTSNTDCRYVSPMVVSKTLEFFPDVNHVRCNTWMPLYNNKSAWESFGLPFYVRGFSFKRKLLMSILLWLQTRQKIEKYNSLYKDFVQVSKIISGTDETRLCLKN